MPHLAALDFQKHDAGVFDGDDYVDLVVLEMVGYALTRNDEIVGFELRAERLPSAAFAAVGEGPFGDLMVTTRDPSTLAIATSARC